MDKNLELSWDDGERVFWRGKFDAASLQHVLLARPATEQPLPESLVRLAHEFELKDELDGAWAVRPLMLAHERSRTMLVLEDPGGKPLAHLLGAPLDTGHFLELALGIAGALNKLHQRGLVHKDLKPTHILVDCADGRTRFTGFGLASRLPRERQAPAPPETIAGTLAHMHPQHTGRMKRPTPSHRDPPSPGVASEPMHPG